MAQTKVWAHQLRSPESTLNMLKGYKREQETNKIAGAKRSFHSSGLILACICEFQRSSACEAHTFRTQLNWNIRLVSDTQSQKEVYRLFRYRSTILPVFFVDLCERFSTPFHSFVVTFRYFHNRSVDASTLQLTHTAVMSRCAHKLTNRFGQDAIYTLISAAYRNINFALQIVSILFIVSKHSWISHELLSPVSLSTHATNRFSAIYIIGIYSHLYGFFPECYQRCKVLCCCLLLCAPYKMTFHCELEYLGMRGDSVVDSQDMQCVIRIHNF